MATSLEDKLYHMKKSEFLTEQDVEEIEALPTLEAQVEEARERIITRRNASRAVAGTPVGTNEPLSKEWSDEFREAADTHNSKHIGAFNPKIEGPYKQANKKVIDYAFTDAAVKILAQAGRVQGLWAELLKDNITLYNAITYGNVDVIRQSISDEMMMDVRPKYITEKVNGTSKGEDRYKGHWYNVGHSFTTVDNMGFSAAFVPGEIMDQALKLIGYPIYDDTICRVWGELYGPTIQGGGVYSNHNRWSLFDIRLGNWGSNDIEHGWATKETVIALAKALRSLGVDNVDSVYLYEPKTIREVIEDCKTGFPSHFKWADRTTNLAEAGGDNTVAPMAEGYVCDFDLGTDLAGQRMAKLKFRYDMYH